MQRLVFFLLYSFSALAQPLITTTHPQVANLIREYLPRSTKFQVLEAGFSQDPHHFEPTLKLQKQILDAELLLTPPVALQPWLLTLMKTHKKRTFSPALPRKLHFPPEVLAHFWLIPEVACLLRKQYMTFLEKKFSNTKTLPCTEKDLVESLVKTRLKGLKIKVLVSHNALLPFFNESSIPVLALEGSGHHHGISLDTRKKAQTFATKKDGLQLVYIQEFNHSPHWVEHLIKANNGRIIKWNPNGKSGENWTSPLISLINKLKESR